MFTAFNFFIPLKDWIVFFSITFKDIRLMFFNPKFNKTPFIEIRCSVDFLRVDAQS
jgi:hypothetical protein